MGIGVGDADFSRMPTWSPSFRSVTRPDDDAPPDRRVQKFLKLPGSEGSELSFCRPSLILTQGDCDDPIIVVRCSFTDPPA